MNPVKESNGFVSLCASAKMNIGNSLSYSCDNKRTLKNIRDAVDSLFIEKEVCKSHDINHIDRCSYMLYNAFEATELSEYTKFILSASTLLHDADDEKLMSVIGSSVIYPNARSILKQHNVTQDTIDLIVKIISYVSSSKNGDSIPTLAKGREYMLYPRFVDRLDALGHSGIIRCYQYTKTVGRPLYNSDTPVPSNDTELWKIASKERYAAYKGNSPTMIDHYYDKLLRLVGFECSNSVLNIMKDNKLQPLIDIIYVFAKGELTDEYMQAYMSKYS